MRTLSLALLFTLIAFSHLPGQDCEINNLVVEPTPCEDGMFFVHLDFDVVNPQGNTFGVVGNATNYGLFPYDTLNEGPLVLGPLMGSDETEWEFIVYDLEEPDCQATFELGIVNCCLITDIVVDPNSCQNLETFSAVVNFNFSNTGNVGFDVFDINENPLGFFSYDSLPVTVEGIPSTGAVLDNALRICDNDDPSCCYTVEFQGLDCNPDDCEIYNVEAVASDCDDGGFLVTIDFAYENTGDNFTIAGNGNEYGMFPYDSLPVVIGPLPGDGETVWEFVIRDANDEGCSDFAVIQPIMCPPACGFDGVEINPLECQGDFHYSVGIDFTPVNNGDEGFTISSFGQVLGSFDYCDLPVMLDSFPASGNFFDSLTICDNADPTCCESFGFQWLPCQTCVIYNVEASATPCDTNGQFYVELGFQFQHTGAGGFQVGGNGNIYGQFSYDSVPVLLGPFDGDGETIYEFVVIDLENGFCLSGAELGIIDCDGPCEIGELSVEYLDYTGNGAYNLLLDFDHFNTGNAGFNVASGDDILGFFSYEDLPVTIDSFVINAEGNNIITVCDNDFPDCCRQLEFPPPICEVCEITEVNIDIGDCTSDTTFGLFINFQAAGFDQDSLDVMTGQTFLGTFPVDELPVYIENFPASGGFTGVTICASGNIECCASVEFESPSCDTSACEISEIVVSEMACSGDSTFSARINFNFTGFDNDFVDISTGETQLGFYPVDSLPVLVDGFPATGEVIPLTICENDNPECCTTIEFEALACPPDPCDIFEVQADPVECGDDGTFSAWVNFGYTGFANEFVDIWTGDTYLGFYPIAELPVLVDSLPGTGNVIPLTICENDNPDCCRTIEFEALGCPGDSCSITEVTVDPQECGNEGTFSALVDFNYMGFNNAFVDIWTGDAYLGLYALDSLPVLVDGLPGTGTFIPLKICENDNPECCRIIEFEALNCQEDSCEINNLVVDIGACGTDSTFSATINFEYANLGNDFFEAWLNDMYLGLFPVNELPVAADGLPGTGEFVNLTVCANDNMDCCQTIEFETPDCDTSACAIFEVDIFDEQCTSNTTMSGYVTFGHEALSNDFVDIWSGDTYLGFFPVDSIPIFVDSIPADGNVIPLTVCENDNPDCCATIEFETLNCSTGECAVFNVVVDNITCATDTTFTLDVNFEHSGFMAEGVDIWGEGVYLGLYPLDSSISVSDFPVSEGNVEMLICESDNPACCDMVVFPSPPCASMECIIGEINAVVSECDTAEEFYVTLDFDVFEVDNTFTVVGNGMNYGSFSYDELPLTLGPFPGDGETIWEFGIQNEGADCGNDVNVGIVNCDPSSVQHVVLNNLEIYYVDGHAFLIVPEDDLELAIWSLDGRRVATGSDLAKDRHIALQSGNGTPGMYIAQLTGRDRVYVAKVFLVE